MSEYLFYKETKAEVNEYLTVRYFVGFKRFFCSLRWKLVHETYVPNYYERVYSILGNSRQDRNEDVGIETTYPICILFC